MDSLTKENRVSLLTIPRSDLDSSSPSDALLLQLPPGWKPADLKGARFVAGAMATDSHRAAGEPQQFQQQQQAALVVESKQCSFSCYTVETSNAFIMVPPSLTSDSASPNNNSNNNKRSKVLDDGKIMTPVPARLLKMGGVGASFLELRERTLRLSDLLAALSDCTWDPYDTAAMAHPIRGRTVEELATLLQLSQAQILQGLARVPQVLRLPRSDEYAFLAEEPFLECYHAIVAALTEVDQFQNYAQDKGIATDSLVKEALNRMSNEERFDDADHVLRHCVGQLSKSQPTAPLVTENELRQSLDVGKVAVCVARRLFQRESTAWLDEEAFFDAWQSELPGTLYHVEPDMLLGVAIVVAGESKKEAAERPRRWKYFPADKLPKDPVACFDELFQFKERWLLRELEPYLERLTDDATIAELLQRFTKMESENRDGISTVIYLKK